jgi:hypothetical protein
MNMIERFWAVADDIMAEGLAEEGTMMGTRCLRVDGEFFAMPEHRGGGLIVKLPAARVSELLAMGAGRAFAPSGRVFREWVLVPNHDDQTWADLMREARDFVAG